MVPDPLEVAGQPPARDALDPADAPRPGVAERQLVRVAVRALALLLLPVTGVAYLLRGVPGALGAALGLGLVLVLFGASAWVLAVVAERRMAEAGIGVLVGAAALRIVFYLAVLLGLSDVSVIDGRSLAAATVIAIAVSLAVELRTLATTPQLFWIDAAAVTPAVLAHDSRS